MTTPYIGVQVHCDHSTEYDVTQIEGAVAVQTGPVSLILRDDAIERLHGALGDFLAYDEAKQALENA